MKKYLLTSTAAGAAMAISAPATADSYLSLFGGYSMSDQEALGIVLDSTSSSTNLFTYSITMSGVTTRTRFYGFGSVWVHYYLNTLVSTWTNIDTTTSGSTVVDISADSGFVIGAAIGRDLSTGLRGEIEFSYRKNSVDVDGNYHSHTSHSGYTGSLILMSVTNSMGHVWTDTIIQTLTSFSATVLTGYLYFGGTINPVNYYTTMDTPFSESGDLSAMSIMANVWLDVDMNLGSVHPYIGAGVGVADVTLDVGGIDISDSAVAFQIGAGLGWDLPNNGHRINLEVRRFVVPKLELTLDSLDIPLDYETTDIIVSYRMNF